MNPYVVFVVVVAVLGGWGASSAVWRWRVSRSLHELAKISLSRDLAAEDLVLAFTPRAIGPKPVSRPSARRVGASQ